MKIYKGFNEKIYNEIAKSSGNEQTVVDVKYERLIRIYSPQKVYAERIDQDAFLIGYLKKDSFRIVGMATRKEMCGKGYGTKLLFRCIGFCKRHGIERIEIRTLSGRTFFKEKAGARVVGMKKGDYLMVIDVPPQRS